MLQNFKYGHHIQTSKMCFFQRKNAVLISSVFSGVSSGPNETCYFEIAWVSHNLSWFARPKKIFPEYQDIGMPGNVVHDDVIKWTKLPRYWPFVKGDRRIPLTKATDAELWCLFDLRMIRRLGKQSTRRCFETPSRSLWRHSHNEQCSIQCFTHSIAIIVLRYVC